MADRASYDAGGITFKVSNKDATGITEFELLDGERILGEKENLPPGFAGSFSLNLNPGRYEMYCPGATTPRVPFTVTGTATSVAGHRHQGAAEPGHEELRRVRRGPDRVPRDEHSAAGRGDQER